MEAGIKEGSFVEQKDLRNHEGGSLEVSMEIQDRRVKRTQNLLAKALIALTLEKGYEAVTIRDITERADVGYATFFRHYHSKDELLLEVSEVVMQELTDRLFATSASDPEQFGALIFGYVQQHSEVIRVLLTSSLLVQQISGRGTQ